MKRVNNIANPFSSSDRRMSTLHEANRILYYIAQAYLQQIHVRIQDFKLGGGGTVTCASFMHKELKGSGEFLLFTCIFSKIDSKAIFESNLCS